ncbi:MAG TPA: VCBS repeat-containing protein, partial [Myxococcota bacterium]|nr:VCBS repeat-containing protein [Myxococcota bacterium]
MLSVHKYKSLSKINSTHKFPGLTGLAILWAGCTWAGCIPAPCVLSGLGECAGEPCDIAASEERRYPDKACAEQLDFSMPVEVLEPGDVDGDGWEDLVYFQPEGRCWYAATSRSPGSAGPAPLWLNLDDRWPTRRWLADMNGDGRADALWFEGCGDSAVWLIAASTGSAFASVPTVIGHGYGEFEELLVDELGGLDADAMLRTCDFTGDNRDDVLVFRRQDASAGNDVTWTVGSSSNEGEILQWTRWADQNGDTFDLPLPAYQGLVGEEDRWCDVAGYKNLDDPSTDKPESGSNARIYTFSSVGTEFEYAGGDGPDLDTQLGSLREEPLVADVDRDGADDLILFRPEPTGGDGVYGWRVAYSRFNELGSDGEVREYYHNPFLWKNKTTSSGVRYLENPGAVLPRLIQNPSGVQRLLIAVDIDAEAARLDGTLLENLHLLTGEVDDDFS